MATSKKHLSRRRPFPQLENLESRLAPAVGLDPLPEMGTNPETTLIECLAPPLYVDPGQLRGLADSLVESQEFLGNQVELAYQEILGRSSQAVGKAAWTKALTSDVLETEDLSIRFIATEEFLANADYNAFTMVKFLFSTYLDRQPNEAGLIGWVNQIENLASINLKGVGIDARIAMVDPNYGTAEDPHFIGLAPENRTTEQLAALTQAVGRVALAIRDSSEAEKNTIVSLYQGLLDRTPSDAEVTTWAKAQIPETELLASFLSSREYMRQFANIQTLVAESFAETLFRPVGMGGLEGWTEALGGDANDDTWILQVPGVSGPTDDMDETKYDMVLDLLYANHVAEIKADNLSYISQYDPNFLPQILGEKMLVAASTNMAPSIEVDNQASFWSLVDNSNWNPDTGNWDFFMDESLIGPDPSTGVPFCLDASLFDASSPEADLQKFVTEYWTSAWDWMGSTLIDTIGESWEAGGGATNGNMIGIGENWDWTVVQDSDQAIAPVQPFAFYTATGDVNGDGLDDTAISTPWHFGEPTDTVIDVYSGAPEGTLLYSFVPYPGQAESVPVALGDFDGDGSLEILTTLLPKEDNLDPAGARSEIKVFSGSDGSFLHSFPVPEKMTWTVVGKTPPVGEDLDPTYAFTPGISGVLVGARNLMTTLGGTDQVLLATRGAKLEVWVGTMREDGALPWQFDWTEISAKVANAKDETGELLWPKHAILGNLAAHAISTMDVNEDGQSDIGITVEGISDAGPIPSYNMDILWFDGTTHEPIDLGMFTDPWIHTTEVE